MHKFMKMLRRELSRRSYQEVIRRYQIVPYVINQERCSNCQRCWVECPMNAIRIENAKYWIDPEKCIACGKCVKVCHNACISSLKSHL